MTPLQWDTSVQLSSVTQSCPTLCNPMNHSTPGLPVHHQLPEFTQTHAHRVGDAIQPSHPLSPSSPPAPNPSQHQGLFYWVNSSHEVAKVLEFQLQHQSFQWTPRSEIHRIGKFTDTESIGLVKKCVQGFHKILQKTWTNFLGSPIEWRLLGAERRGDRGVSVYWVRSFNMGGWNSPGE